MTSARIWRALLLLGGLLLAAGLVVLSPQRPATGYHYGSIGSHDFLQYWSASTGRSVPEQTPMTGWCCTRSSGTPGSLPGRPCSCGTLPGPCS